MPGAVACSRWRGHRVGGVENTGWPVFHLSTKIFVLDRTGTKRPIQGRGFPSKTMLNRDLPYVFGLRHGTIIVLGYRKTSLEFGAKLSYT